MLEDLAAETRHVAKVSLVKTPCQGLFEDLTGKIRVGADSSKHGLESPARCQRGYCLSVMGGRRGAAGFLS
jgi:hypothetical protein